MSRNCSTRRAWGPPGGVPPSGVGASGSAVPGTAALSRDSRQVEPAPAAVAPSGRFFLHAAVGTVQAIAGVTVRPSGSSAPPSSNSTTPLHSRLHPCPGWLATALAALRSGARASGHRGQCQHACCPACCDVPGGTFRSAIAPPIGHGAVRALLPEAVTPTSYAWVCDLYATKTSRAWRHPKVPVPVESWAAAEGTKVPLCQCPAGKPRNVVDEMAERMALSPRYWRLPPPWPRSPPAHRLGRLRSRQPVHESLGFLLEHRPTGLCVVLASRSDPPLGLRGYGPAASWLSFAPRLPVAQGNLAGAALGTRERPRRSRRSRLPLRAGTSGAGPGAAGPGSA